MSCINPVLSNCIQFTAGLKTRLSELGYTATTFEDWIVELSGKTQGVTQDQLASAIAEISTDSLSANSKTFGLRTGSVDAAALTNKSVEYSTVNNSLTYSFADIIKELPSGFVHLGSRVDVVDSNGKKTSVKGATGKITVSLPANIYFSTDLRTANGNMVLDNNFYVEGDVTKKSLLDVKDYTVAPTGLKQRELNEYLAAEIALLKQKV